MISIRTWTNGRQQNSHTKLSDRDLHTPSPSEGSPSSTPDKPVVDLCEGSLDRKAPGGWVGDDSARAESVVVRPLPSFPSSSPPCAVEGNGTVDSIGLR